MVSKFPLDFSNFELEITNRCNLACPRCSRTDFIEMFPKAWVNSDLNLDDFKRFIAPVLDKINIFEFKGTMGDPIFHPEFGKWVKWCKTVNKKVYIHTNAQAGSALWKSVYPFLDKNDKITLGIDGLPHDFMQYRINAKWKNIEACVDALKDKTTLVWQFIRFRYNQDEVNKAKALSKSMQFDDFVVIESNRWKDENDWLKPAENSIDRPSYNQEIDPVCVKSPMHIVTADGYYMPCCMLIDHRFRYKTPWAKTFNITKCTIEDVIKSSIAQEFFAKLDTTSAPDYCKFNCGKCNGI